MQATLTPRLLEAAALLSIVSTAVHAQGTGEGIGQQDDCVRIYASPDGYPLATGKDISYPVDSLGTALGLAQLENGRVTIVLLPGTYDADDEGYPYDVPENVSIQGTNATNTILEGTDSNGTRYPIFTMHHLFRAGIRYERTVFDGLTFREMSVGLSLYSELGSFRPVVSNCVFAGGSVGIAMETIHGAPTGSPVDIDGNGYSEHRPEIVNCTFSNLGFGIVDTTMDYQTGLLFGESEPAVLNCLFVDNTVDLRLIDDQDVMNSAFEIANAGPTGSYKSGRVAPVPIVNTAGLAPFVSPGTGDFRLLPSMTSLLGNKGRSDLPVQFLNATIAEEPDVCGMSILDYDAECYGNPRIEGSEIDLGADEIGEQIVSGFNMWTTEFDVGDLVTIHLTATSPACQLWTQIGPSLDYLVLPFGAPGARADGTLPPGTPPAGHGGTLWIDLAQTMAYTPMSIPGSVSYTISSAPPMDTRINQQILAQQAAGTEVTNLQTFTILEPTP